MKVFFTQLVFVLIFLLMPAATIAQYTLSAKVKDKNTSESLAYSTIALISEKGKSNFVVADKGGYFEIPVASGKYQLIVRYVGYVSDTLSVHISNRNLYLGVIKLESLNRELEGVEINASTKNEDIDKNEVIVTNKMRTGASSAREVLEKVDGVSYDRFKDDIKVDNDGNIIILVNGLQKNQEYIKNLDPERIAKIEVIRDPSGRYGIEGYTAILNIVLKQNYVGQEVFLSSNDIFDLKPPETKYLLPIQDYSLGYNFTRKNLNLYSQINLDKKVFALKHTEKTSYSNGIDLEQLAPNDGRNMVSYQSPVSMILGADYIVNAKNTLSAEVYASYSPESPTEMNYDYDIFKDTLISSLPYHTNMLSTSKYAMASMFYIGNYSDTKKLKADMSYGYSSSNWESAYGFKDSIDVESSQQNTVSFLSTNVEWSQDLSSRFSWQIGYGGKWSESHNDNMSNGQTSHFLLTELRNKVFTYGVWKFRKYLRFKFGLGMENSYLKQNRNVWNFWLYKPHIDIFFKPYDKLSAKLKYRVNTQYPSISQADSTELHQDVLYVSKGNPNLVPTTIHKLSLKINIMSGLLSVEPYIEFSNNYIAPVSTLRADGLILNTYGNLGVYQNQGVKVNLTIPLGKSLVWTNGVNFYHSKMAYEEINNNLSDWSGESQLLYVNQKLNLVTGLLYQRYNGKYISLQGYSNQQNDYWGFLAQKSFFNKRFNVMLMAFLPIDWLADYEQYTYTSTVGYERTTINDVSILKNLFMIRLSYRFHKGKTISTIDKDVDKDYVPENKSMF